ncbi:hypothetical protein BLJAPNOD_02963 [Ensifer sp. M14]|uniref:hypothetical protein n=1 Tax=Ensifer sp. M14 TaxID=2203782 RepID=UPI000E1DFCCE|nr:hypothetical protein [Ensifer sp. M14]RDL51821.1 hypothetical protein BLJAPNOD_02963 [Ensifer sp. M14]
MAKLPEGFSLQAMPIEAALAEGRDEDAKQVIFEILSSGTADRVTQRLAAEMLKPPKRKRGRRKELPKHWYLIATRYLDLQSQGVKYDDLIETLEKEFRFSERHILNALAEYRSAKAAHDEATQAYHDDRT